MSAVEDTGAPPGGPGGGTTTERRRRTLRLVLANPVAAASLGVLVLFLLAAVVGPALVRDPLAQDIPRRLEGPSGTYWSGTDNFGRDELARVVVGARASLVVALTSVGIALVAGTAIGVAAGFYRRWVDDVLMRLMDVLFSFPAILLAVAIVGVRGPSRANAIAAIAIVYTPLFARVARASTLSVGASTYVRASRSLGVGDGSLVWRHVLPNIAPPLIVQTSLSLGFAILSEAALSFLGLGTAPPDPSWGRMLFESRDFLERAPWLALAPGLAIVAVVLSCNLLGDALRDALDPRQRSALETRRASR